MYNSVKTRLGFGTKQKTDLVPPVLGKREIQTLNLFWGEDESGLSAIDISELMEKQSGGECPVSLNTIQSTIERLWRKNLLSRKKVGKAYIYLPRYSKKQVISSLISEIRDEMGQGDESIMLSGIIEYLQDLDSDLTSKLLNVFKQHNKSTV
ncbi:BlaI/MecI/CopY family transcriptional regulator [Aliiglaciecola lipolytica]|uniref:CopY family transcriptional regulator n=1 Tax=Aliiglaciecola lipolytica E3 TaxID=1127673 RepID=K6Y3X7_9ALTE|nr:BlaI/MecI/CopY family transcriptional regulator [Aliiglaciecola lipolytica]GAC12972.1 hypothetical protein GLIP_0322 [Aliiglaciecola lipolytica E3]